MAEIVLGLGTSHSPQLNLTPDVFHLAVERDKRTKELWASDGQPHTYNELLEMADPAWEKESTQEKWEQRHEANQKALATLSDTLAEVAPDVLVVIGDDQRELFHDDNIPAMLVYYGDTIWRKHRKFAEGTAIDILKAAWGYGYEDEEREYPVASSLATHIIGHLVDHEFDVARSNALPQGKGMGHAFGFVYRRIVHGRTPIPVVPILLNTYYPPNQPTPKRCYDLGRRLREAIEGWDSGTRVAMVASGGLSHMVIDEELDRKVIKAMEEGDGKTLASLPRNKLNSGNSEIRNWIVVAGACEHLRMNPIDYIPLYRSPAGTGCGMAFARWK